LSIVDRRQGVDRVAVLRRALRVRGLDAMLVSSPSGIRYLTGFSGSSGFCVVTHRGVWCLTDSRYRLQVREEVRGATPIVVRGGFASAIARHGCLRRCRSAGVEEWDLTLASYRGLRKECAPCLLKPAGEVLSHVMSRKDAGEIRRLERAVEISDGVFRDVVALIRPGVTERDLAAEISYRQRRAGADGDAFDVIVASGWRSALPHARATAKKIRNGEIVLLDFGCGVEGYHSDMTRTVVLGRAGKSVRDLYRVVLRAQEAGLGALRAGCAGREVDAVVRRAIAREGFGRSFPHSTGHGVGLRVHEAPRLSPFSADLLEEGNVVTVEPGIYIPDRGGIRIEDMALVTKEGSRVLTASSKELMIL
jgi:Xaa-Pro aminopeptidase